VCNPPSPGLASGARTPSLSVFVQRRGPEASVLHEHADREATKAAYTMISAVDSRQTHNGKLATSLGVDI